MKSGENHSSMSFRAGHSLTAIQGLGYLIAIRVSIHLACGLLDVSLCYIFFNPPFFESGSGNRSHFERKIPSKQKGTHGL